MDINLQVSVDYVKAQGTISNIAIPSRKNEFSGTASNLYSPNIGQRAFQLSSAGKHSIGINENKVWRVRDAKYNGFVSYSKCDENRIFQTASDVTITFSGLYVDVFTLYFDNISREWATKISVNGVTYENNNAIFVWRGEPKAQFNIVLLEWNRPNVSARITSVIAGLTVVYDKTEIMSLKRGMQMIADNNTLSWSVLGQYGNLELSDIDGEIRDLANVGVLKSGTNIPVRFYLDGKQIGAYIGDTWSYNEKNQRASVSLVSNLNRLENIIYNGFSPIEYNYTINAFIDLSDFTIANGFIIKPIDYETTVHFANIIQRYLTLEQGNLRETGNKFCVATQTQWYFDEEDEITIKLYR